MLEQFKKKKEKQVIFRVKTESHNRLKAFAEAQGLSIIEIACKCLKAYRARKPKFGARHEFNQYRDKTQWVRIPESAIPEDVNGDSHLLNEIILWWTDKNGKYPAKVDFIQTEKYLTEEEEKTENE